MSGCEKWPASLKRTSLCGQAAEAIREGVATGAWRSHLPGERRLCEAFHVSRPTISSALHQLAREGLIRIEPGRSPRIVGRPAEPRRTTIPRSVAIIVHDPIPQLDVNLYHAISEIRLHLAKQGFASTIFVCPRSTGRTLGRKIEAIVRENRPSYCILWSPNQEMQCWFAGRSIPTLVLGTCIPGLSLPSIDTDHGAVCRHAVGVFVRRGHRRISLVLPGLSGGGTLATERGFLEGVRPIAHHEGARVMVTRHNNTASDLRSKLDGLFAGPTCPTALLVARSEHVIFVLHYLLKRNLPVPGKVSLIARDYDPLFPRLSPSIAHYCTDSGLFSRRLIRMVLQLVARGHLPPSQSLILPNFFAGQTVADLH